LGDSIGNREYNRNGKYEQMNHSDMKLAHGW
jgi:hypothetical protein